MKISELPEPYRSLAKLRRTQRKYWGSESNTCEELSGAFAWDLTPEGWDFWNKLDNGKAHAMFNKEELEMTIEEIAAMPGSYTMDGFTPGNLYAFWDGDEPSEWTVARYSHSERTTPFDRHWTADKKYFAHVGWIGAWNPDLPRFWESNLSKQREILAPEEGA